MDWIEQLTAKRKACYSCVAVVETNDDRRPQEYMASRLEEEKETLEWDTFQGLTLHSKAGSRQMQSNDLLTGEVNEVIKYLNDGKDRVVVIKNLLTQQDIPMKALNTWAVDKGLFEKGHTVVVFVPDRTLLDSKVLDKCIFISPPFSTPEERKALLDFVLGASPKQPDGLNKEALVEATGGLDLNQTEAVFLETLQEFLLRQGDFGIGVISRAKADIINKSSGLKIRKDLSQGFERIGGYDALKEYIMQNIIVPMKDPERAKELGMELPRGLILFGPGGTGKTVFAKALAKEVGLPFCTLSPENFMSSLVGESEKQLRNIIKLAEEMAPIIIFIDEIDRLGGRGEGGENDGGTSKRLFTQFLEWLGDENRRSFIIGATNAPYMDAAFRREGRFDNIVPMLSPDVNAREAILKVHLNVVRKVKHDLKDIDIRQFAELTDGWKGNMLEELVKRAVREAFVGGTMSVRKAHFQAAYDDYQVNQAALKQDEEKYIQIANELCNSRKFLSKLLKEQGVADERMKALRRAKG